MKFYSIHINEISPKQIQTIQTRLPLRYAYAKRYKHESDFLRCIGVGVLLLQAFPCLDEAMLRKNEHGKLRIENELEFSVSHSGTMVVLVTNENAIGIDIEEVKERWFSIAKSVFTPEEQNWMNVDVMNRFFILWTQKESLVKAVGCGITVPLNSFSVLPFEQGNPIQYVGREWYCITHKFENYVMSVCASNPLSQTDIKQELV